MARYRDGDGSSDLTCRRCGGDVPAGAQFCPSCGSPPDAPETPLLCGHCGHTVEPGQQFCISCGTALSELSEQSPGRSDESSAPSGTTYERPPERGATPTPTPAIEDDESDVDERTLKAFRRRLDPYLENGWEIRRDDGDSVELFYRDFGSIGIHAALALFLLPLGWGNALYAIYSALVRRNSATVRADDDPRRWPSEDPRPTGGALRWTLGVVMILVTIFAVVVTIQNLSNPVAWIWLLASVIATGNLLPPVNRRLRERGSLSEFGWRTETAERLVHDSVQCTVCSSFVDVAVERSFEKYFAVAGARVTTAESGENYYCESCCQTALSIDAYRDLSDLLEDEDPTVGGDRERSADPELERS